MHETVDPLRWSLDPDELFAASEVFAHSDLLKGLDSPSLQDSDAQDECEKPSSRGSTTCRETDETGSTLTADSSRSPPQHPRGSPSSRPIDIFDLASHNPFATASTRSSPSDATPVQSLASLLSPVLESHEHPQATTPAPRRGVPPMLDSRKTPDLLRQPLANDPRQQARNRSVSMPTTPHFALRNTSQQRTGTPGLGSPSSSGANSPSSTHGNNLCGKSVPRSPLSAMGKTKARPRSQSAASGSSTPQMAAAASRNATPQAFIQGMQQLRLQSHAREQQMHQPDPSTHFHLQSRLAAEAQQKQLLMQLAIARQQQQMASAAHLPANLGRPAWLDGMNGSNAMAAMFHQAQARENPAVQNPNAFNPPHQPGMTPESLAELGMMPWNMQNPASFAQFPQQYGEQHMANNMFIPSIVTIAELRIKLDEELLAINFADVTVSELKEHLRRRQLSTKGRKQDLLDELLHEKSRAHWRMSQRSNGVAEPVLMALEVREAEALASSAHYPPVKPFSPHPPHSSPSSHASNSTKLPPLTSAEMNVRVGHPGSRPSVAKDDFDDLFSIDPDLDSVLGLGPGRRRVSTLGLDLAL